jgi:ribosomal protein S27E
VTAQLTSYELAVTAAWHVWGDGYALYTRCSGCGEIHHCRGKRRERVLCIECFDRRQA